MISCLLFNCKDTGEEKRQLVLSLGAEKWIDFRQSKDIVQDIRDATEGVGAHAAIVVSSAVGHTSNTLGSRLYISLLGWRI